jgi:hypothetical protein
VLLPRALRASLPPCSPSEPIIWIVKVLQSRNVEVRQETLAQCPGAGGHLLYAVGCFKTDLRLPRGAVVCLRVFENSVWNFWHTVQSVVSSLETVCSLVLSFTLGDATKSRYNKTQSFTIGSQCDRKSHATRRGLERS